MTYSLLPESEAVKELFKIALLARERAYSPYSGHKVGGRRRPREVARWPEAEIQIVRQILPPAGATARDRGVVFPKLGSVVLRQPDRRARRARRLWPPLLAQDRADEVSQYVTRRLDGEVRVRSSGAARVRKPVD